MSAPEPEAAEPPLVDTHCHLAFSTFDEDRDAVLARAREAGLVSCVAVAVDAASAEAARDLALAEPGFVHPTAGVHPTEELCGDEDEWAAVRELLRSGDFVAVGETGLDAFHDTVPLDVQERSMHQHLELALELDLPVVLHCRDAFDGMASALERYRDQPLRGVLHCFTGTQAELDAMLDAGLHVGLGGIVTFKARADLRDAALTVPPERLLVETDAPWLAPVPRRGRRNEPAYVRHVATCLADVFGEPLEALARRTTANAVALFGERLAPAASGADE